jgi:hypothetical protein
LTAYIPSAIHRPDALSGAAAEIAEAPATRAPERHRPARQHIVTRTPWLQ